MSVRYLNEVRYGCDSCGTSLIGHNDVLPEGWRAIVWGARIEHFCPRAECELECEKKLAPPEAKH
jgi:hypothetical protein